MRASPPGALTRLMRNMRTLPQYAALVNPVLPVCHVTDLRKQHGRGVSEQVESCLDCLDMGTAVLLAGLTRALVATALAEARQGTPPPAAPARWVGAALAAAARHGLAGAVVDPFTGRPADAHNLRWRLLDHVQAALSASTPRTSPIPMVICSRSPGPPASRTGAASVTMHREQAQPSLPAPAA
jgi:hypothetical protein